MTSEQLLFKKIDNPVEFRRNLLEASKQMIHGLQKYEKLKVVRVRKAEQISKLKSLIKEINSLNSKMKKEFPDLIFKKTQVKKEKKKVEVKSEKKAVKKAVAPEKKGNRELTDLENQLKDIETKLQNIS
ncbi:hypothetical protein ACFL6I_20810 [candidate division KSB1 bacterium]